MALAPSLPPAPPPLSPPAIPGGCECSDENQGMYIFPLPFENCDWPTALHVIYYTFWMIYFFYAVSLVSNVFMESIEVITAKQKTVKNPNTGEEQVINVWNPTVANLTLMALGSSAPEILLSVIEVVTNNFESGELGPGTIVGSAAFNLLMIVAICVIAIPEGQVRRVEQVGVFILTSVCSLFAYIWLYIVLRVITPDKVSVAEACITFGFFPILVVAAYGVDKGYHLKGLGKFRVAPTQDGVGGVAGVGGWATRGIQQPMALGVTEAAHLVAALRSNSLSGKISEADLATLAAALKPKSRVEERKEAMKNLGHRKSVSGPGQPSPERLAKARLSVFNPQALTDGADPALSATRAAVPVENSDSMPVVFESHFYRVSESDGKVVVKAMLLHAHAQPVTVAYMTRDGQGEHAAKAGVDYTHAEGILSFSPGETHKEITIPIIDDDLPEPDETFEIALSTPASTASANGDAQKASYNWEAHSACKVLIIDDDRPGTLRMQSAEVVFDGSSPEVTLTVLRHDGNRGDLRVRVCTSAADGSVEAAHEGKDFEPLDQAFTIRNTVSDMLVTIPITTTTCKEAEKGFLVRLQEVGGDGAAVVEPEFASTLVRLRGNAPGKDGGGRAAEDEFAAKVAEMFNAQLQEEQPRTYKDQFESALRPETDEAPTKVDWVLHSVCLPWKLLFATCPPPTYGGGWYCFGVSLGYIGLVTFFIQEVATMFGCVIGMAKACNAVVFVALGTSLPDALASKSAALNDLTADASVGNVTGSNCVNVFLGLGLPWLMCSVYWAAMGATSDWTNTYSNLDGKDYTIDYPDGGFIVPGDDLGFAVVTFVTFACICFAILGLRRVYGGGELGGPVKAKWVTFFIFAGLWVAFITLYCVLGGEVVI